MNCLVTPNITFHFFFFLFYLYFLGSAYNAASEKKLLDKKNPVQYKIMIPDVPKTKPIIHIIWQKIVFGNFCLA